MSDLELNCGTNVDWIDTNRDGRGEIVIYKFNEKIIVIVGNLYCSAKEKIF